MLKKVMTASAVVAVSMLAMGGVSSAETSTQNKSPDGTSSIYISYHADQGVATGTASTSQENSQPWLEYQSEILGYPISGKDMAQGKGGKVESTNASGLYRACVTTSQDFGSGSGGTPQVTCTNWIDGK